MWYEIIYPFSNFNGCTFEVWGWISYSTQWFIMDVITFPYWDLSWSMWVKGPIIKLETNRSKSKTAAHACVFISHQGAWVCLNFVFYILQIWQPSGVQLSHPKYSHFEWKSPQKFHDWSSDRNTGAFRSIFRDEVSLLGRQLKCAMIVIILASPKSKIS